MYHPLQVGAVNGSEEFRLGVSINLDMKGTTATTLCFFFLCEHKAH